MVGFGTLLSAAKWFIGGSFTGANALVVAGVATLAGAGGYIAGRLDGVTAAKVHDLRRTIEVQREQLRDYEASSRFAETLATETVKAETENDKSEKGIDDAIAKTPNAPGMFDRAFLDGLRRLK